MGLAVLGIAAVVFTIAATSGFVLADNASAAQPVNTPQGSCMNGCTGTSEQGCMQTNCSERQCANGSACVGDGAACSCDGQCNCSACKCNCSEAFNDCQYGCARDCASCGCCAGESATNSIGNCVGTCSGDRSASGYGGQCTNCGGGCSGDCMRSHVGCSSSCAGQCTA